MSQTPLVSPMEHHDALHLHGWDKARSWTAWGVAVAMFVSVGWLAVEPDDPAGAVSLLTRGDAWLSIVQVVLLSAVASGAATLLIGRKLPDAGVFAASLGLASAAWRGETTTYLLVYVAGAPAGARSTLALQLGLEGLVWFAPVLAAMLTSAYVARWNGEVNDADAGALLGMMSASSIPGLRNRLHIDGETPEPESIKSGLQTTIITLFAAAIVYRLVVTGGPNRLVQHGQSYFAVAAAFFLGGRIAYSIRPVANPFWLCVAPPLLCLFGYLYTAVMAGSSGPYDRIASVPPTAFFRSLPVEYVSVGTAACVVSFWSSRKAAAFRSARMAERGEIAPPTSKVAARRR